MSIIVSPAPATCLDNSFGSNGCREKVVDPVDPSCPLTRRPLMHRPDWRQPPRCFDTRRRVTLPALRRLIHFATRFIRVTPLPLPSICSFRNGESSRRDRETCSYFIEDSGKNAEEGRFSRKRTKCCHPARCVVKAGNAWPEGINWIGAVHVRRVNAHAL